jgi:hypothetical protein
MDSVCFQEVQRKILRVVVGSGWIERREPLIRGDF